MKTQNKWHHMAYSGLFVFVISLLASCGTADIEGKYQKEAQMAVRRMRAQQKPNGSWRSVFSQDSIGQQTKKREDAWVNLYILHLISALDESYLLDSTMVLGERFLDSVRDTKTGFLMATLRPKNYPPEAGLNAFYALYPFKSSAFLIPAFSDSLEQYRNKNKLYKSWLRRKGNAGFPGMGRERNPADFAANGLLLLYFQNSEPQKATKLYQAMQQIDRTGKLVAVYHHRAPWFLSLLRKDLLTAGYQLNVSDYMGKPLAGQEKYTMMAHLIDLLNTDRANRKKWLRQADKVLAEVSADKFALIREQPMLIYHSDLTAKKPFFVWSQAVPVALWLRLYDECRLKAR